VARPRLNDRRRLGGPGECRARDRGRGARGGRAGAEPARFRRGPGGREERRRVAGASMAKEGRAPVLPAERHERDPGLARPIRLVGQGAVEIRRLGREPVSGGGLSRRAELRRAARRLCGPGRRADALFRQSRRLCGREHDGRHLGDGRLLRPDRQELPSLRRGRHRRRARALAGQSHGDRGQLLHRRALGGCGRRGGGRRLGALDGRVHLRLDQNHRSGNRRSVSRARAALFGGGFGHLAGEALARRLARPCARLRGDRQARRRRDAGKDQHQRTAAGL
ncbi:MAG: 2,3,4,5-tetrahydropyridine-2,6-dicarboxylate N-succinyltransferase, partial [uncultured Microvirga sp.]